MMKRSPFVPQNFGPSVRILLCATVLLAAGACDGARKVTERLRAYKQAASTASGQAAPALAANANCSSSPAHAALEVTVVPSQGITLLIDGHKVGDTSPYLAADLPPGPHMLVVRAMGYHDVTLPVELALGQRLVVPVALRPRHGPPGPAPQSGLADGFAAQPPGRPTTAPATAAAARPAGQGGPRLAPNPSQPQAPPEPLPSGAQAMVLDVQLVPPGPITVEGAFVPGRQVRMAHGTGELGVSGSTLRYRVYPGHVLELVVPHDGAAWFRDGAQVKATSQLRLEGQPMQLRRVATDGTAWQATLHRLE